VVVWAAAVHSWLAPTDTEAASSQRRPTETF